MAAELPRGAVTFVFTDIEGSTRLVRELGWRYAEVLAAHRELIRAAFGERAGREIDSQGDSFFYVFANARDALLAAYEAQRALATSAGPTTRRCESGSASTAGRPRSPRAATSGQPSTVQLASGRRRTAARCWSLG
jgi:class 3 adenylate cyclase